MLQITRTLQTPIQTISTSLPSAINDGAQNGATIAYTVTVNNLDDEAPVFSSSATPSVAENVQNVVSLSVTDSDSSGSASFTITGGADNSLFEINAGTLRFASAAGQNYESMTCASNPCVVVVRATDAGGNTADQTIQVTITDADEFNVGAPADTDSDANTLAESVSNGASAEITASATDADGTTNTVTYAINSQSCSGAFAIDAGSGAVTVADTSAIDYETAYELHYYRQGDQRRRLNC